MTKLFLLSSLALAGTAYGGFQVDQKVSYSGNGTKADAALTWQIGPREFRLDVKRGADIKNFVFNGRVFYVCGKLDKPRLDYVKKLNLPDPSLVASLEKGACQELSTDFALRFFLSPYDAALNVEVAGGFGTSLTVAPPSIELTGEAGAVGKVKCVEFTHSYKIEDKAAKAAQTVTETACNATGIPWRQAFSRELGLTLMRQPGGRPSFQALAVDLKKMAGLSLTASGKSAGRGANGKDYARTFEVQTSAVKTATPGDAQLGLPAGFQVLDTGNLASLAANHAAGAKAGAASAAGGPAVGDVLRALILGVNPASGLVPP